MTAKTTLVQLHHKIDTFQHIGKHLVLAAQEILFAYMQREFSFAHLEQARLGDSMHFHSYSLAKTEAGELRLQLAERWSTDSNGIARCLGLRGNAHVELDAVLHLLESKISSRTILSLNQPTPPASLVEAAAESPPNR